MSPVSVQVRSSSVVDVTAQDSVSLTIHGAAPSALTGTVAG